MRETPTERARFRRYALGVLHAAEFLCESHDQPTLASEMVRQLLHGQKATWLRDIARFEGVALPRAFWSEVKKP